ncbi:O-acyltransferase like protein-like [Stomoxys calcitrans]|uniref:O-acyltransferase like protein-like n=1 Tax=Stomoxys calcitrans TaxID=35570 RepID=UPI0027E2F5AF|nr:O-acyltransferase like protein-like [Stomoxys calcitrans]
MDKVKMKYSLFVVIILSVSAAVSIVQGAGVGEEIKYTIQELPPLYNFDDYDLCFFNKTSALSSTYCMVYAEVQPDNSSQLWEKIEVHNRHRFHYHHDKLFFGLCVERCLNYIKSTDDFNSNDNTEVLDREVVQFFQTVHKRPLDIEMRSNYSTMIQRCLNEEFERKYDLKLKTFIEYCERNPDAEQFEKDVAEDILYRIVKLVFLLVIFSSFYDYYLKTHQTEKNGTNDFYKINYKEIGPRVLTSFSIPRNYYRLVQPCHGIIGNEFSYLDGFRSVCTLMVLQGHTFYMEFLHLQNPEYFENIAKTKLGLGILNTSTIIEIFMVMSGLLFYVKFNEGRYVNPQTSWRKCIQLFAIIVTGRLLRFLPSVALTILINATVLSKLTDGPFWRHISEPSRVFSRENWWQNIFMINNFTPRHSVSGHTWYIAADFQLFAFYTMVLIFIFKYPQYKKRVLATLSFLAVFIPTMVSYTFKLEPSFMIKPEAYRYGFFKDMKVFGYLYIPFYTNIGGYLFGILCGELYVKYLSKDEIRRKVRGVLKYELGAWVTLPIACGISLLGTIAIFQQPSIWTALFSGLNRNLWIIFVCGIPVLGMACKGGLMAYDFCCLPIFRVLARLSFQMYLWHVLVLQIANGYQRQPHHMTHMYFNGQGMITVFMSIIVAFFACLLVEYPIAQLFDTLMASTKRRTLEGGKAKKCI